MKYSQLHLIWTATLFNQNAQERNKSKNYAQKICFLKKCSEVLFYCKQHGDHTKKNFVLMQVIMSRVLDKNEGDDNVEKVPEKESHYILTILRPSMLWKRHGVGVRDRKHVNP